MLSFFSYIQYAGFLSRLNIFVDIFFAFLLVFWHIEDKTQKEDFIMENFEKFSRRILVTSVVMQRAYTRLHQTRTGFLTPLYVYPLHSGRRASKFDNSACGFVTRFASLNDRDFPSVDELDGFSFKYIKISFMLALVTSRQRRVITTFYFSTFRCREIFYLYQIFSQKNDKTFKNSAY